MIFSYNVGPKDVYSFRFGFAKNIEEFVLPTIRVMSISVSKGLHSFTIF